MRLTVFPSPRAKTINGQGAPHSRYFFSRSSVYVNPKGQGAVEESRKGDLEKLYRGRIACCHCSLVVPIPVFWLKKIGQWPKNLSCPATTLTSPQWLFRVVASLLS